MLNIFQKESVEMLTYLLATKDYHEAASLKREKNGVQCDCKMLNARDSKHCAVERGISRVQATFFTFSEPKNQILFSLWLLQWLKF